MVVETHEKNYRGRWGGNFVDLVLNSSGKFGVCLGDQQMRATRIGRNDIKLNQLNTQLSMLAWIIISGS